MYSLGIDIGTTFSAAGVFRDGHAENVQLGTHRAAIPSVVAILGDETTLAGEAAERRARTEPDRVARGFKRRFGDTTPIMLGGVPRSAEQLTARLLSHVLDAVVAVEGGEPDSIVVTHPASWSRYKLDALEQTFVLAGRRGIELLPEPVAAALHYAGQARIGDDARLLVYDLGGGTFDVAVVANEGGTFSLLGEAHGIERMGGMDFDAAVLAWALGELGDVADELRRSPRDAVALRDECVAAKEVLSVDTEVVITGNVGGRPHDLRLTRSHFEDLIRPTLTDSMVAVRAAVAGSGVQASDLDAVVLVGGSSRIPLVSEMVADELRRPVAVDAHPKMVVCKGAARHASQLRAGPGVGVADTPAAAPVSDAEGTVPDRWSADATAVMLAVTDAAGPAPTSGAGIFADESSPEAPTVLATVRVPAPPAGVAGAGLPRSTARPTSPGAVAPPDSSGGLRPGILALAVLILVLGALVGLALLNR